MLARILATANKGWTIAAECLAALASGLTVRVTLVDGAVLGMTSNGPVRIA